MTGLLLLWTMAFCAAVAGIWLTVRGSWTYSLATLAVGVLALLIRFSYSDEVFYGLEYEDAYVYTVASLSGTQKHFAFDHGIEVCIVGSLASCQQTVTFTGHLAGFVSLLRGIETLVGFNVALPPNVGAFASALTATLLVWVGAAIYGSIWVGVVAGLIFASIPAVALYGGSGCSESVSALPLGVAFGAIAMARNSVNLRQWWAWQTVLLVAVLLAVSTRRENAALLVLLPLSVFCLPIANRPNLHQGWLAVAWVLVAIAIAVMIWPSVPSEVREFGQVSFGLSRLFETAPTVLRALFTVRWFGLTMIGALIGTFSGFLFAHNDGKNVPVHLALVAVGILMVGLYSAHIRSAYQLAGKSQEPFDFLRYLSNLGVCIALLAAPTIVQVWRLRGPWTPGVLAVSSLYLGWCTATALLLRQELTSVETEVRRDPARSAIEMQRQIGNHIPIVTIEPMLVQIYGDPTTQVVFLPSLTPGLVEEAAGQLLYVQYERYESSVDKRRYSEGFAALPLDGRELRRGNGWRLIAFGLP